MDKSKRIIISLIKSALYKTKAEFDDDFDWAKAESIIRGHNIYGLIYYGLKNSGIEIPAWLSKKYYNRIYLLENLWNKGNEIQETFKKNGIEYIPLKGIIIKDLYPSPYMRSMSDIDILIREKDYEKKIRPLMLEMGYSEGVESDHELHWGKNGQMIELHKRIIPSYNKDFYKVIGDGWNWVQKNQYAYIFTHFAKHYRDKGIGISHLVDLEVLKDKATKDGLLELRLDKFYENVQRTLDCWFRDKEFDEVTERITDVVFSSGEYGREETSIRSQNYKKLSVGHGSLKKAKFKDLFAKLFPPYNVMVLRNPILKKWRVLLPFIWIIRIMCSPFRGNIKKNIEQNKAIANDDGKYKEELNSVGLDFWF